MNSRNLRSGSGSAQGGVAPNSAQMMAHLAALTAQNAALQNESKRNAQSLARLQTRDLPVWDERSDVRDFIAEWRDDVVLSGFTPDTWPRHFKKSLPVSYRTMWQHTVDVETLNNGNNCPPFDALKDAFLSTILDVSEPTTILSAMESPAFKMRYTETLLAFYARFRHAVERYNEAIAMSDSRKMANSPMRQGPLSVPDTIRLFGKALIPALQKEFIKHRDSVTSLEDMYAHVRKEWDVLQVQRQYYSQSSPDADPHSAPLIASSIAGKPTAQVERKFHEQSRIWNPSNQILPLGAYGMPVAAAPQSHPDFHKELAEVKNSFSQALADIKGMLDSRRNLPSPTDKAADDAALISVALHTPETIPEDSGYDACSLPVAWGCDPFHVALARVENGILTKYCVWCESTAHNCRECPAHCFRCGQSHVLTNCTLTFREAKCSQGHNGHLDNSCLTRILGLIDPNRPPRNSRSQSRSSAASNALPGRCFKCGEMGHWASSCSAGGLSKQGFTNSAVTCYRCNQPGHTSDKCTNIPRANVVKSEPIAEPDRHVTDLTSQIHQTQKEQTAVLSRLVDHLSGSATQVKSENANSPSQSGDKRLLNVQEMHDEVAKRVKFAIDQLPAPTMPANSAPSRLMPMTAYPPPGVGHPPPLQPYPSYGYTAPPMSLPSPYTGHLAQTWYAPPQDPHTMLAPPAPPHGHNGGRRTQSRGRGGSGHGGGGGHGRGHGHGRGSRGGRGGHAAGSR